MSSPTKIKFEEKPAFRFLKIFYSGSDLKQIKSSFAKIDIDKSGKISPLELVARFRELGLNPTEEDIQEIFNHYDINGDGELEFDEFQNMIRDINKETSEENVKHIIDSDSEFKQILSYFDDNQVTIDQDQNMMLPVRPSHLRPGCIDINEFSQNLMANFEQGEVLPNDEIYLVNQMMSEFGFQNQSSKIMVKSTAFCEVLQIEKKSNELIAMKADHCCYNHIFKKGGEKVACEAKCNLFS